VPSVALLPPQDDTDKPNLAAVQAVLAADTEESYDDDFDADDATGTDHAEGALSQSPSQALLEPKPPSQPMSSSIRGGRVRVKHAAEEVRAPTFA